MLFYSDYWGIFRATFLKQAFFRDFCLKMHKKFYFFSTRFHILRKLDMLFYNY